MTVFDLAEAQIAVHWKEEEAIPPPPSFIAQANLTDPDVDRRFALENFPECYAEYGEMLTWYERWEKILDDSTPVHEYPPGTWGPDEADALTADVGGWHSPLGGGSAP